jgi:hypothetical protein
MKKGLVVVSLAVVSVVAWRLTRATRDPSSPAPVAAQVAPDRTPTAPVIPPRRVDRAAVAMPEADPDEHPESPVEPEVADQVRVVHDHVLAAARPCYADRPPAEAPPPPSPGHPDETMQNLSVTYTVVVAGGVATLGEVVPTASELEDEALASCIVASIQDLRWATTAPDGRLTIRDTVNVGDLDRRVATARSPKPTTRFDAVPPLGTVVDGPPHGWTGPR